MNSTSPPAVRRALAAILVAVILLALAAPAAAVETAALPALVPAFELTEIVHDRARLVQISIVAVLLGIALLWVGQK